MATLLFSTRPSRRLAINCSRLFSSSSLSSSKDDHQFVIKSTHKSVETVVGITLPELVWSNWEQKTNLEKWENSPAFQCGVTGRTYTHMEVYRYSRGFAAALLHAGFRRGDVVAIMLPNVPEYAIVFLGIMEAGLVASTANPAYTEYELKTQMDICKASCIVTLPQFFPVALKLKSSSKYLKEIVVVGDDGVPEGTHSFAQMIKSSTDGVQFLKGYDIDTTETTAAIPFSSGTTGPPKGVMLTHSNLATNLLQQSCPTLTALHRFDVTQEQDRLIGILPFYHIFGLNVVMTSTLFMGCHCVCLPKFDPASFAKAFRSHRPTVTHLVTPILNFMLGSREFGKKEFESLRTVIAGAAPIGPHIINSLLAKAEKYFHFQEGYGMSELSPVSHMLPPSSKNVKIGSCGQLLPSTLGKIIDVTTGELLGPNQRGEVCVKGAQVMKGYFENEKATAETIDAEGWLHTGDIGYYDDDNYFYLVDRLKELIKVKGLQVAPSELEDLLRKLSGVGDCAVIGVPSESSGELPRAYIVKNDDKLSSDDVHNFVKDKVMKYKHFAGGIEFVDAIPKAPSGKILRRELKASYLEKTKGK